MRAELPDPSEIVARWGAQAAALAAIGIDDVWWFDADGAQFDDSGGNWSSLCLVDGGRAMLFGSDHEYSETESVSPPIDLLADAPAWLPLDVLNARVEREHGRLGYVYWFDDGVWSRVGYPARADGSEPADGLLPTVGPGLDDEDAIAALADVVWEWGQHDPADDGGPDEAAAVTAAAGVLLAAAHARTIDADGITALVGRLTTVEVDVAAGVAMASKGGLTAGSTAPTRPPATTVAARRARVLSDEQHQQLVWAAMQHASEARRPEPAPTRELLALVEMARAHAPHGDGRCSLLVGATANGAHLAPGEFMPVDRVDDDGRARPVRELFHVVRQVWEADADPRHGHWLFLRLETTATDFTVERRYDSWPSWMPSRPYSGPSISDVRNEMDARADEFRPAWVRLLAAETVFSGPEDIVTRMAEDLR